MKFMLSLTAPLILGIIAASPATALPDCSTWNSGSFLGEAAVADDVAHCLAEGADLKAWDSIGSTPLHWSAGFSKTPAVMQALLDAGADPKARD